MQVNVTRLINDVDPFDLSASVAERGQNAGRETWQNAKTEAETTPLELDRDEAKEFFKGFGAWEEEEIDGWTDSDVDALVLQFAASDLRELQSLCPGDGLGDIDWKEAEKLADAGTVSGRLYANDDALEIYIGD